MQNKSNHSTAHCPEHAMIHSWNVHSCNEGFLKIAEKLMTVPDADASPRGYNTREILNVTLQIKNPYARLVTNHHRKISLKYLVGEWLWYERGSDCIEEISYYSKFWNKISDDQKTANSCYGKKLFSVASGCKESQWDRAKNMLQLDSDSRRAVLLICEREDIKLSSKDVPCTMYLQFLIRGNALHLIASMRSNDLILGFTYDVPSFTMFQERMLLELQVTYPDLRMGTYTHHVGSMHVYEKHYLLLSQILKDKHNNLPLKIPRMRNIREIPLLQENEKRIRKGQGAFLLQLQDDFCKWCQDVLHH